MPHIHTKPSQHDFTVSAFIVRTDFDEPKAMVHKHKKLGLWMQFGGHVELNENPWQALTHELLEEAGYDIDDLQLLEPGPRPPASDAVSHPLPFSFNTHLFSEEMDHYHIDLGYAFVATGKPKHDIGEGESQEIQLFSREELKSLSTKDIPDNTKQAFLYILDNLL